MDPSGTYLQFDAKAIGSGSEGAQQSLQEAYHKSMTLKEATKSAFTILKQVLYLICGICAWALLVMLKRMPTWVHRVWLYSLTLTSICHVQVMEEKLNETNVEAARVTKEAGFQLIKGEELEAIIKELDA